MSRPAAQPQAGRRSRSMPVAMRPPLPSLALSRRARISLAVVASLIVLLIVVGSLVGVYINWLWFGEVGYRNVYKGIITTKLVLFLIFGVLMALILGGNIVIAWDYPAYRLMLGFGFIAILFSILLSIAVHYLFGAIRVQTPGPKITLSARRHLTVLIFVFIVLKALAYWLDRYGVVFSNRGKVTGASYTDVNASLPAKTILFWMAVIIAAAVLASIWLTSAQLPAIAFGVLLVLSIIINGIYPAVVQQFSVKPNASDKEAKYISRNIEATREGFDIVSSTDPGGTVNYVNYDVNTAPSTAALTPSSATVSDIRILDPNVVSQTF